MGIAVGSAGRRGRERSESSWTGERSAGLSRWSSRHIAYFAVFAASIPALGVAVAVPNVELVTLTAFCAGWLLGGARGPLAAAMGELVFTLFNPLGPAHPLVMAAQVLAMAGTALAGAGLRRVRAARGPRLAPWAAGLALGAVGALITLGYDLLTNTASGLAFGLARNLLPYLAAGLSFGVIHIVSNTILFAALGPSVVRVLERHRAAVGWGEA